jgi:hypothetical protein
MKDQRQVGQHVHHLRKRGGGTVYFSRVVGIEDQRARVKKTVAQPRTVAHQMANGDRPDRRLGLVQRRRAGTQHTAVRKLRNEPLNRIVELEAALLEQKKRSTGRDQLRIRKDAEYVVDPQRYRRFLVGPSNACHIHQIPADEHRGRESGKKIPVDVALHGSARRPEVVPGGCDFHVFHDWPLVHARTRPTSSPSMHDFVAERSLASANERHGGFHERFFGRYSPKSIS